MRQSRSGKEVYLGASLAVCAVVAGFVGYRIGQRPAVASAAPAQAEVVRATSYQYKVINVGDLFPEMTEYRKRHGGAVLASWSDGKRSPPSLAEARPVSEAEVTRRVALEVNRMGEEGWEPGDFGKQAWPVGVPAEDVMFFRRAR